MKIAITGGAGFIGTALMKRLQEQGHEPYWIDIKPSINYPNQGYILDVTNEGALIKALEGAEVIYHLAAEHRDDVKPTQKYFDVNVGSAKAVVKAAKANQISAIIFTSTVAVYGLDAGESQENSIPKPFNNYGKSKLESEEVFQQWAQEDKQNKLAMIRLVATFGAGNRGNIYTLMNQIARNKFIMIGKGSNRKSIAYVGNVSAFLSQCLYMNSGVSIYNYADKPDLSMRELVSDIRLSLGLKGSGPTLPYIVGLAGGAVFDGLAYITRRRFPISLIRVRKFCANTIVSAAKMEETGFKRPFTLREGLQEMAKADFNINLDSKNGPGNKSSQKSEGIDRKVA